MRCSAVQVRGVLGDVVGKGEWPTVGHIEVSGCVAHRVVERVNCVVGLCDRGLPVGQSQTQMKERCEDEREEQEVAGHRQSLV